MYMCWWIFAECNEHYKVWVMLRNGKLIFENMKIILDTLANTKILYCYQSSKNVHPSLGHLPLGTFTNELALALCRC